MLWVIENGNCKFCFKQSLVLHFSANYFTDLQKKSCKIVPKIKLQLVK